MRLGFIALLSRGVLPEGLASRLAGSELIVNDPPVEIKPDIWGISGTLQ